MPTVEPLFVLSRECFLFVALATFSSLQPTLAQAPPTGAPKTVVVTEDNTIVTESCIVRPLIGVLLDADGNGILHIHGNPEGKPIVVDFDGGLLLGGANRSELLTGIGIVVTGK